MYHAFTDEATDQEKQALLSKIREQNAKGDDIPEDLATNPSTATLAYHRLIDAPADVLEKKGSDERAAAHDLLKTRENVAGRELIRFRSDRHGVECYSARRADDKQHCERYESGDHSGAATDIAALVALGNAGEIARRTPVVGKVVQRLPSSARRDNDKRRAERLRQRTTRQQKLRPMPMRIRLL